MLRTLRLPRWLGGHEAEIELTRVPVEQETGSFEVGEREFDREFPPAPKWEPSADEEKDADRVPDDWPKWELEKNPELHHPVVPDIPFEDHERIMADVFGQRDPRHQRGGAIHRELGTAGKFASLVQLAVDQPAACQRFTDSLARAQTALAGRDRDRREREAAESFARQAAEAEGTRERREVEQLQRDEVKVASAWPSDFPSDMAPEPDWKATGRVSADSDKLVSDAERAHHLRIAKGLGAAARQVKEMSERLDACERDRDEFKLALLRECGNHRSTSGLLRETQATLNNLREELELSRPEHAQDRKYALRCEATDVFGHKFHVLFGPLSLAEIQEWLANADKPLTPGVYQVLPLNQLRGPGPTRTSVGEIGRHPGSGRA